MPSMDLEALCDEVSQRQSLLQRRLHGAAGGGDEPALLRGVVCDQRALLTGMLTAVRSSRMVRHARLGRAPLAVCGLPRACPPSAERALSMPSAPLPTAQAQEALHQADMRRLVHDHQTQLAAAKTEWERARVDKVGQGTGVVLGSKNGGSARSCVCLGDMS